VLILLLLASSLLWPPASGPGESSAPPVDIRHRLAGGPAPSEARGSGPSSVAVLHSEGRTYRILVGRDSEGRTWSAAFAVGD
jgi:hypothetical protein